MPSDTCRTAGKTGVRKRLCVIGGGAFGTALAQRAARNGAQVLLWTRNARVVGSINDAHRNAVYFPKRALSPRIQATTDLTQLFACDESPCIFAAPSHALVPICRDLASIIGKEAPIQLLLGCKGLDPATGGFLHDSVHTILTGAKITLLSGPSFASDIINESPLALVLASVENETLEIWQQLLFAPEFRLYASTDLVGVAFGGACKNVMAIAAGIARGAGFGESALAALITRGFAEMCRMAGHRGASMTTLRGLAGLGDLVLTCTSTQSRNMRFGMAIGRGATVEAARREAQGVIEGEKALQALLLHGEKNADTPIASATRAILQGEASIKAALAALLQRPAKYED